MRLSFHGAARMVTGSCYLAEAGGLRVLVDCGMFQGPEEKRNKEPFAFRPEEIDFVVLTHAHIDHSGRLPLLYKRGYRGPIITHPATVDLAEVMLLDSARIQEQDAEYHNKKARRAGRPLQQPLYTEDDVRGVVRLFRPLGYEEQFHLNGQVSIRFLDAGHILGSAVVEVFVEGEGKLVFSGDIGEPDRPILRDPVLVDEADYLVMESTYGNRLHDPPELKADRLLEILTETVKAGGNLIIPAFSVGRTQELLYELNGLAESQRLPAIEVIVDSPLGIRATEITRRHREVYDRNARDLIRQGDDPFQFKGLRFTETVEESKELNRDLRPKIIIAGSGMCEGGRVVHHLKHNLWRPESTVLFVGYQAEGTLGRRIRDGARRVRVLGEEIEVRARIEAMDGFSAHADQAGLIRWAGGFTKKRPARVFLTHGEPEAQDTLIALLREQGIHAEAPELGDSVQLDAPQRTKMRRNRQAPGVNDAAAAAREVRLLGQEYRRLARLWRAHQQGMVARDVRAFRDRAAELRAALEELARAVGADEPVESAGS